MIELKESIAFTIDSVDIGWTVVGTSIMVLTLSLLGIVAGRKVSTEPAGWQAVVEWGALSLRRMLREMTGTDTDRYFPLVATIAVFIATANLVSVLPYVDAPTANLNTPVALAIVVFIAVQYFGIRRLGLFKYLTQFTRPVPILLPIRVLEQFTRTISLAVRLFGNMMSHQIIVAVILLVLPLVVPVLLELFGIFIGVIQAYVFTILTVVYIGGAVQLEE